MIDLSRIPPRLDEITINRITEKQVELGYQHALRWSYAQQMTPERGTIRALLEAALGGEIVCTPRMRIAGHQAFAASEAVPEDIRERTHEIGFWTFGEVYRAMAEAQK